MPQQPLVLARNMNSESQHLETVLNSVHDDVKERYARVSKKYMWSYIVDKVLCGIVLISAAVMASLGVAGSDSTISRVVLPLVIAICNGAQRLLRLEKQSALAKQQMTRFDALVTRIRMALAYGRLHDMQLAYNEAVQFMDKLTNRPEEADHGSVATPV